ncbi:hypothetical protein D3C81_1905550 [compost metagenome]
MECSAKLYRTVRCRRTWLYSVREKLQQLVLLASAAYTGCRLHITNMVKSEANEQIGGSANYVFNGGYYIHRSVAGY